MRPPTARSTAGSGRWAIFTNAPSRASYRRIDNACYTAKDSGRNQVVHAGITGMVPERM